MEDKPKNRARRGFLFGFLGFGVGYVAALASAPALQRLTSLWFRIANNPSALTNIEAHVRDLPTGENMAVTWKNRTVYVFHRTQDIIASTAENSSALSDPKSQYSSQPSDAQNKFRSKNPQYFVVFGECTHLGCAVHPVSAGKKDFIRDGGFFCGCHGGVFDFSGRVLAGYPPPANLEVPPYYFKDKHTIIIGENSA